VLACPTFWGRWRLLTRISWQFAENSKKKKDTIVATFTKLREIIMNSRPTRIGFSDDPHVREHADKLYQAVVDSIRDMLRLTAVKKAGFEGASRRHRTFPSHILSAAAC